MQDLRNAFNENDIERIKEIKDKMGTIPNVPKDVYYQAVLFEADLKDHMASLDYKIRQRIDEYIYQSPNWVTDTSALIIFGDSMPILSTGILDKRMGQVLRKYKNINSFSNLIKVRISTICINYLFNAICIKKSTYRYIPKAIRLIKELPANDILGLKKLLLDILKISLMEI